VDDQSTTRDETPVGSSPDTLDRRAGNLTLAALAVAALGAALAVVDFRAFELDRFFVPKELALHLGALGMALMLASQSGPRRWSRADLALGAWVTLSIVSMFAATSGWHASRAVALTLGGAVVFWATSALRAAGRDRGVVIVLCLAATLAGLSALAQAYGFPLDIFASNRAPGGTLGNRNFIAHVAAMSLPMILWLVATTRSTWRATIGSVAVLAASGALVLSRTRAAWLALAIWLAIIIPLTWRGRDVFRAAMLPGRKRLIAGALGGGLAMALVLPNVLDWRSDSPYLDSVRGVVNYRDGSGAGRIRQWTNSLRMVRAHPVLGVGPGNWAAKYPAFAPRNDPSMAEGTGMTANPWPSSDWVAAVSERGVLAALALMGFVALLLWNAWRGWSDSVYSSRERAAALAGGSVVLVGAIQGSFDAVTLLAFPAIVMWGAAGALIPASRPVVTLSFSPETRRKLALGAGILWSLIVVVSAAKIEAMRRYSRGTFDSVRSAAVIDRGSYRIQLRAAELQASRGMCRLAYHNANLAVSLFPHAPAGLRLLQQCANTRQ
jgi:O-antigen ligase